MHPGVPLEIDAPDVNIYFAPYSVHISFPPAVKYWSEQLFQVTEILFCSLFCKCQLSQPYINAGKQYTLHITSQMYNTRFITCY